MIRLGLLGASGRMGQWVIKLIENEFSDKISLVAKMSQTEFLKAEKKPQDLEKLQDSLFETDVLIDFSSVQAVKKIINRAVLKAEKLPHFIIGSTGWSQEDLKDLEALSQKTSVFLSSNFSSGVFIIKKILETYTPLLNEFNYTPVLIETHHKHKKDAPGGTALDLRRAINPQSPESIQTHCIRAGEVIGQHEITFYSQGDSIKIEHTAQDRSIFARGALEIAVWLSKKEQKNLKSILGMNDFFESLEKKRKASYA